MELTELKGIGPKTKTLFNKIGVFSAEDLVRSFPRNFELFEKPSYISEIFDKNFVTICGAIKSRPLLKRTKSLTIITATIYDESGKSVNATWFNQPYITSVLKPGVKYIFRGKLGNKFDKPQLEQPAIFTQEKYAGMQGHLRPIYHLTKGVSNNMYISAIKEALSKKCYDSLPESIISEMNLISAEEAFLGIHFPDSMDEYIRARTYHAFDEIFSFVLAIKKIKGLEKEKSKLIIDNRERVLEKKDKLSFKLTSAQENVLEEILSDMASGYTMNRLIQGDVGSGKTIISLLSMINAFESGHQAALMAPTEVLAYQHFKSIAGTLKRMGYSVRTYPALSEMDNEDGTGKDILLVLLRGSMTAKEKKEARSLIESGEAGIIIGTHAIITDSVKYKSLALAVIDEQHRFGVNQRKKLKDKGESTHVLVMSATPIPRTLALIVYGDMDISVINELPKGRKPIKNCVVDKNYRPNAYKFIYEQIAAGGKAYVICPMVEYTDGIDAENVVEYSNRLFHELSAIAEAKGAKAPKTAYLHGQMSAADKEEIMQSFAFGDIDVLVSTTVIEVGIDVPEATVILIEDAQRFGLAQLHQLRGRVGRGESQSYCILIDTKQDEDSKSRLDIMNHSNDGFFIASKDLELRGPGDALGIRQSGDIAFKIADLYNDAELIKKAAALAEKVASGSFYLSEQEKEILNKKIQNIELIL